MKILNVACISFSPYHFMLLQLTVFLFAFILLYYFSKHLLLVLMGVDSIWNFTFAFPVGVVHLMSFTIILDWMWCKSCYVYLNSFLLSVMCAEGMHFVALE